MTKPTTVYLESRLLQAAKLKALQTHTSVSKLVNEALRFVLREDEADLRAFRSRKKEPLVSFEKVVQGLKKDGLL